MTNCDDYPVPIWDRPAVIHFDGLGGVVNLEEME